MDRHLYELNCLHIVAANNLAPMLHLSTSIGKYPPPNRMSADSLAPNRLLPQPFAHHCTIVEFAICANHLIDSNILLTRRNHRDGSTKIYPDC